MGSRRRHLRVLDDADGVAHDAGSGCGQGPAVDAQRHRDAHLDVGITDLAQVRVVPVAHCWGRVCLLDVRTRTAYVSRQFDADTQRWALHEALRRWGERLSAECADASGAQVHSLSGHVIRNSADGETA